MKDNVMQEYMTAKRKGFKTDLEWLISSEGKILNVMRRGEIIAINSKEELMTYYEPIDGKSSTEKLFSAYGFADIKGKVFVKKTKPTEKIRRDAIETYVTLTEKKPPFRAPPPNFGEPKVTEEELLTEEVVYDLIMEKEGEVQFVMEFESLEDLEFHLSKMRERYLNHNFYLKTKNIVSKKERIK